MRTEYAYAALLWDELDSRFWLGQLKKKKSYILSHRATKTYKRGQVQEGRERKGQGLTSHLQSREPPLREHRSGDTA